MRISSLDSHRILFFFGFHDFVRGTVRCRGHNACVQLLIKFYRAIMLIFSEESSHVTCLSRVDGSRGFLVYVTN